jgi:hypothetical protein
LAALLGLLAASAPAWAKPAGKRIAVLPVSEGTAKDAVITAKIVTALKQKKILPVSGAPVKKALGKEGVPSSEGDWGALARKLKVDGLIESSISGSGAKRSVELVVRHGADGSVAGRETFSAKGPPAKLAAAVASGLWKKLGSTIKETTPPKKEGPAAERETAPAAPPPAAEEASKEPAPAAETEPAEKEGGEAKAAPAKEPWEEPAEAGAKPPAARERPAKAAIGKKKPSHKPPDVELEIGGRFLRRVFQYTPASAASAYAQNFMPTVEGRAAWFPILYAGIFLTGEYNPALKTNTSPAFPAGTRELVIGAQGRYPLSVGYLGLSAAYFQHLFLISDTSDANDAVRSGLSVPDTAYQGVRIAASGRFYLGDIVQVGVEAAFRRVTNPGEGALKVRSDYYFPNGMVSYGLDGSAFVSVGVLSWLAVRGAVDFRRYAFGALDPGANGSIRATGATDDYLGFSLGVVGVYGDK